MGPEEKQLGPAPPLLVRFSDYGMRYAKTWPDSRRFWATDEIPPDALICVAIAQLVQIMVRYVDSQTPENASICDEQLQNVLSMKRRTLNM